MFLIRVLGFSFKNRRRVGVAIYINNNEDIWSFNSARKFFGVPDGAYLYSPEILKNDFTINKDIEYHYLINRLIGKQELAYKQFIDYESGLDSEIKKISIFSNFFLSSIDYDLVIKKV